MRRRLAGLRLGVVLLFMIGLLSPFAATGVGAQDLTCDDFNSQRAAQAVLEADPSLEDALDPDGDGVACNEDEPVDEPTDDPTDDPTEEPADDPTEEPSDDPTDDPTDEPSGDAEAYLADIQDEVDAVVESFDRQVEITTTFADASSAEQPDLIAELEDLAASWAEYPDVAAEFEAPAGLEDVEDAYFDFADAVGEAGDTWLIWWDIPQGDPEEDAALDDFTEAFDAAYAAADDVTAAIEDAGGATEPTDDPTEEPTDEPSGDADAYLADIQAEVDALQEQVDRFLELDSLGADATQEDVDEINDIAAGWVEYPDVAAEFEAPDGTVGFEDIESAYLDLADTVGEAGELWEAYWAIPIDDPEEAAAEEAFFSAYADVQDGIDEVQGLLDDAGSSTGPSDDPTEEPSDDPTEEPTDDPTEEPTDDPVDEPSGDAEEYLATVSDTAADWQASIDRFSEIIGLGADATDADTEELAEILVTWADAPDVAAELDVPDGFEDIQTTYEDFADELATASSAIAEYLGADADSPEAEAAFTDFITAVASAQTLYTELDELLTDAGA